MLFNTFVIPYQIKILENGGKMNKKRNLVVVIFLMTMFLAVNGFVFGSPEDYRVIKNGVKGKKQSGEVTCLRIEVVDKKNKKSSVKVRVPLDFIYMLSDMVGEDVLEEVVEDISDEVGDKMAKKLKEGKISLKMILSNLKKYGPMTLIEVDEDDEMVKIWIE